MPFVALFAANLQDFSWLGEAHDVRSAMAALFIELSELAFDPSEFDGLLAYLVGEGQLVALIDWCGSGSDPAGFPTDVPAPLTVTDADRAAVFLNAETLAKSAMRW